jgi:seryl-tRNA synthetase
MLTIQNIRENKDEIIGRLKKRNKDFTNDIDAILALDESKRAVKTELDNLLAESNSIAKEIGQLMKEGNKNAAEEKKARATEIRELSKNIQENLNEVENNLLQALYKIPNAPSLEVPNGKTPEENEVVLEGGVMPNLSENALPHWEITNKYDLIDFENGVKITGAGFPIYKGKGAKLQRALIAYFLDQAEAAGYLEYIPPFVINEASGYGTGQLPDKEGQMYHIGIDDLYLIPTAEVPVTNIHRDTIYQHTDLPIKNTAYTPCFRREAGSYGKDVRGLNRLHQFDKVEIVQIQHPEKSYQALQEMVEHVKKLVESLELPYRILKLCGGDMGFTSALTYDFEIFSAAQKKWLEVSSVSNFETFQANRLKLRFKDENGKIQLLHTLNGSALALPRIVAGILENNQTENGIKIPKVLVPYTKFEYIN